MGIKNFIPLFIPILSLFSNEISLELLNQKDRSFEKDFYIYKYLKNDNLTNSNVIDALGQSKHVGNELFFQYAKKINHDETLAVSQCMQASPKDLVNTNIDCIVSGLTLKKALLLNSLDLDYIIQLASSKYPIFAKKLKIINSSIPFSKLISSDKEIIYDIYFHTTNKFLLEKLNYKLPKSTLSKIIDDDKFLEFLEFVIKNRNLNLLQSTFFEFDDSNLSSKYSFLLALNRANNGFYDEKTVKYLNNAYMKSTNSEELEKIFFWKALIEKRDDYLMVISKDTNLNFYTLYAKDYYKVNKNYSLEDYILPYENRVENCTKNKKALFYSIAKNLSSFNEKKIDSFNLGLTQLNFLTLKNLKIISEEFDELKLLDTEENIKIFLEYITFLEDKYITPHKILYLYNKTLDDEYVKYNFEKSENLEFEPFLSIELASNSDFLKKSITNYLIYLDILGEKIDSTIFFESLIEPLDYLDQ